MRQNRPLERQGEHQVLCVPQTVSGKVLPEGDEEGVEGFQGAV